MKKNGRLLMLTATLLSSLCATAWADPAGTCATARVADACVAAYWDFADVCGEPDAAVDGPAGRLWRAHARLADLVVDALNRGDRAPAEALAARYAALDEAARAALDPAVGRILDAGRALELSGDGRARTWLKAEEFPGYGFPEAGYAYRRGRQLREEFLQAYWQDEERVLESRKAFKATLDVKLAAQLKNDPAIGKYLELGKPYKLDINGSIVLVVDVSFETKSSFTTKCRKKYQDSKVWYELLRRKSGWFSQGAWENCGETWLMKNEPTGHEVLAAR